MKSVLISIQPKWVEKIIKGEKTIEVRKTRPKLETPFKCYIYYTKKKHLLAIFRKGDYIFSDDHKAGKFDENIFVKGDYYWSGKVIGEFVCDKIDEYLCEEYEWGDGDVSLEYRIRTVEGEKTCLEYDEVREYGNEKPLYFWHISDLKIYDKPKDLSEFKKPCYINEKTCYDCQHTWGFDYVKGCNGKIEKAPQSWCYVEG